MDEQTFAVLLAKVAMTFGYDLPDGRMEAYWEIFSGVDESTFAEACDFARRNLRFFPAPVDLLDYMRQTMIDPGTIRREFAVIAKAVAASVNTLGSGKDWALPPDLSDAAVEAYRAVGGYRTFRDMDRQQEPFTFRDFQAHYLPHIRAAADKALGAGMIPLIAEKSVGRALQE
jgi:hypothetical protein